MQNEIARALAKENLTTEARIASTSTPTSTSTGKDEGDEETVVVASSASLREDVEEARRRAERFQKRGAGLGVLDAERAREEVVKCYRSGFIILARPPPPVP